jgi:hypothetical protein
VQVRLELADRFETLLPDAVVVDMRGQMLRLEEFAVHAHRQDFLVVRAVENPDPAALGQRLRRAP